MEYGYYVGVGGRKLWKIILDISELICNSPDIIEHKRKLYENR